MNARGAGEREGEAARVADRTIALGLAQLNGAGSRDDNLQKAGRMADEASRRGARILCFPELFSCPWFAREAHGDGLGHAEDADGPTSRWMRRTARRTGLVLVGSLFERADRGCFNTALIVDTDGTVRGAYRKNHIPDVPGFWEGHYYGPGQSGLPVFDLEFGRIGLQICSDLMVPEGVRILGLKGAELVCAPRATSFFRIEQWRTVMQAEAITSGCFVASTNRCGREGDLRMGGMSLVVHPQGRVIAEAGSREEVVVAHLDLDHVREYRARYPLNLDSRADLYTMEYGTIHRSSAAAQRSATPPAAGPDRSE